jgi:hypothetical protein
VTRDDDSVSDLDLDGFGPGDGVGFDPAEDVPDFVAVRDHVREELVRFVRSLRRAGVEVPANAAVTGAQALVALGFDDRAAVRAGLKSALLASSDDVDTFERLFPEFWRRLTAGLEPEGPDDRRAGVDGGLAPLDGSGAPGETPEGDDGATDTEREEGSAGPSLVEMAVGGAGGPDAEGVTASVYSRTGRSVRIDAAESALAGAEGLRGGLRELTRAVAELAGRRFVPGDERTDMRRALRESFGTGGTVLSVPRQSRAVSDVRALLLVDVSQSVLDVVDRSFLLGFLRAATTAWRDARTFIFDDSVREVTDAMAAPTPKQAVRALNTAEAEWGGGTRIGEALTAVRERHPEAVDRRTVVFVLSDGLEVGEVTELERGMAWLARRAAATVWLNPLAGSPAYEPTCRGMAAALPYVDGLFAFAGPADIDELARQLRLHGDTGALGYEYDPRRV